MLHVHLFLPELAVTDILCVAYDFSKILVFPLKLSLTYYEYPKLEPLKLKPFEQTLQSVCEEKNFKQVWERVQVTKLR